ncbi:hypothetical protein ACEXQD_08645 [Herbiconiux sp. P15]|uniref:hypothetical protein n=1 Tax=Herbiconiux liukaitaii TaxID=3342799 RepID=UPI0035B8D33C
MQAGPRHLTPDEFWSRVDETDERLRESFEPVGAFGLVEWPGFAMVSEWEFGGSTRVLSFAHALPQPPTDLPGVADDADGGGRASGRDGNDASASGGDGDPFEVHVHWRDGDSRSVVARLRRRALTAAGGSQYRTRPPGEGLPDRIEQIEVEGLEQPFELWERGDRWWAATTLSGRTLAVEARGVTPAGVALHRIADVEPYLAGRRAWLRRIRAES